MLISIDIEMQIVQLTCESILWSELARDMETRSLHDSWCKCCNIKALFSDS